MSRFRKLFDSNFPHVIGMIHVGALPGTPRCNSSPKQLIDQARKEAKIYVSCNVNAVLIENMHDVPYVQANHLGPEITAVMTRICSEIKELLPKSVKCGVQVLAGGNKEALAIAKASDLDFIRCEGFIYGHLADEGLMNSCAGELLRYRKAIDAEEIQIFTDIKKKHCAHSLTADVTIEETAKAAEFFLSDGVILTGCATGDPADATELVNVKKCTSLPVLIGSGVTVENINQYLSADAIIVGSYFKKNGRWANEVDKERVDRFMSVLRKGQESDAASF